MIRTLIRIIRTLIQQADYRYRDANSPPIDWPAELEAQISVRYCEWALCGLTLSKGHSARRIARACVRVSAASGVRRAMLCATCRVAARPAGTPSATRRCLQHGALCCNMVYCAATWCTVLHRCTSWDAKCNPSMIFPQCKYWSPPHKCQDNHTGVVNVTGYQHTMVGNETDLLCAATCNSPATLQHATLT